MVPQHLPEYVSASVAGEYIWLVKFEIPSSHGAPGMVTGSIGFEGLDANMYLDIPGPPDSALKKHMAYGIP